MAKSGSSVSSATRWVPLVGGEDYSNTSPPKGLYVITSVTVGDVAGRQLVIDVPGYHPLSPTTVIAASSAYALF